MFEAKVSIWNRVFKGSLERKATEAGLFAKTAVKKKKVYHGGAK